VRLTFPPDDPETGTAFVRCELTVEDLRDVGAAVERCRRLLDADCDPVAVADGLSDDPRMATLVRQRPGLRVPGSVDGAEIAIRAVIGQQISLAGAISLGAKLVDRYGTDAVGTPAYDGPGRMFPSAEVLAEADPDALPMPRARGRALVGMCRALADGTVPLDRSADRSEVRARLLALPGIGPWTADYVAMRALGDPDVFLPTDIGVRRALVGRGDDAARVGQISEHWRPWRSYGLMHLWSTLDLRPATHTSKSKEN
jgi:AraC family transcriptional regulator of adaptative response / DNA-3-methyladenine glycosylase II